MQTPKAILAYAWVSKASPKYKKFEATVPLPQDVLDEYRKVAQELIDDNLKPKQAGKVEWNPFSKITQKDGEEETEVPVLKARSGFKPSIYKADGSEWNNPPNIGPGSKVRIGFSFEINERDDGDPQLLCRLKSVQVIKLVEAGGVKWANESDDDDADDSQEDGAEPEKAEDNNDGDEPPKEKKAASGDRKKATDF